MIIWSTVCDLPKLDPILSLKWNIHRLQPLLGWIYQMFYIIEGDEKYADPTLSQMSEAL